MTHPALGDVDPPHRSRKNRRRWCRGKPGVEHQAVTRLSHTGQWWRTRGHAVCGWDVLFEDTYTCWHEVGCAVCGKKLDCMLGTRCPDYAART